MSRSPHVLACVFGDTDIVRPLGLAGVRSAVVAERGAPVRFSRFVDHRIDLVDPWTEPERLIDRLVEFARRQDERPVLVYGGDPDLLMISRHRHVLAEHFRFAVPNADLVEDLVDKQRFQALAGRLGLPVPPSVLLQPSVCPPPTDFPAPFPLVLKPVTRETRRWQPMAGSAKAIEVASLSDLRDRWPALTASGGAFLAQQLVAGPESRIESYHVYTDDEGAIVGEFTGVKIRTYPTTFGNSSAVAISAVDDVLDLGRSLVAKLQLRGVAKLDFKRDTDDRLVLLEVNPRFSLWHHPGALAGVNIPALYYADMVGEARPSVTAARAGVTWCRAWADLPAARSSGMTSWAWLKWFARSDARRDLAWNDPATVVGIPITAYRRRFG